MSFLNRFNRSFFSIIIFILFISLVSVSQTNSQNITLSIDSVSGQLGEKLIPLDINITNVSDTIAGFTFWIQMSRPDLLTFHQDTVTIFDTTFWSCNQWSGLDCIDSTQVFTLSQADFIHVNSYLDTLVINSNSGSVSENMDTYSRSLSGLGTDTKITGLVPFTFDIVGHSILPTSDTLLFKLYLDVVDTLPLFPGDSTVDFYLISDLIDNFNFSDHLGNTIGTYSEMIIDTSCFTCTQWIGEECLNFMQIPLPNECDSIAVDTIIHQVLDTSYFQLNNGYFKLLPEPTCGYTAGTFDISNLVSLVDFMFASGPELSIEEADCNCDCLIDVADLVCFVDYMFGGGADPGCGK
ncbi:MAG: hypothetical protein DWP97_01430 [Calditrichaeota bacterium]|nr:MAG: hypothetical protein DWP97_01430 [Calditrichota bacterium]